MQSSHSPVVHGLDTGTTAAEGDYSFPVCHTCVPDDLIVFSLVPCTHVTWWFETPPPLTGQA